MSPQTWTITAPHWSLRAEAQRGEATCPRPHRNRAHAWGLAPRSLPFTCRHSLSILQCRMVTDIPVTEGSTVLCHRKVYKSFSWLVIKPTTALGNLNGHVNTNGSPTYTGKLRKLRNQGHQLLHGERISNKHLRDLVFGIRCSTFLSNSPKSRWDGLYVSPKKSG